MGNVINWIKGLSSHASKKFWDFTHFFLLTQAGWYRRALRYPSFLAKDGTICHTCNYKIIQHYPVDLWLYAAINQKCVYGDEIEWRRHNKQNMIIFLTMLQRLHRSKYWDNKDIFIRKYLIYYTIWRAVTFNLKFCGGKKWYWRRMLYQCFKHTIIIRGKSTEATLLSTNILYAYKQNKIDLKLTKIYKELPL